MVRLVAASSTAKYTLYLSSCRNNFQKFQEKGVSRLEEVVFKALVCLNPLAFKAFGLMVLHHSEVVFCIFSYFGC